jgi:plasmid stabilization system protein ParE
MKVRFLPAARREFDEALAYYYRLRPLVARNFLLLARRMSEELAEYPEARPAIAAGLHEHRLIGFGESLVYRIDNEGICVVACAHPGYEPGAEAALRSKALS